MIKIVREYTTVVIYLVLITFVTSLFTENYARNFRSPNDTSTFSALIITINKIAGDVLFLMAPYALATIEHAFDRNLTYGDCRIKNLIPTGFYVVGTVINKEGNRQNHLRAYVEKNNQFIPVDYTCPTCEFDPERLMFIVHVQNYEIQKSKIIQKSYTSAVNYVYVVVAAYVQKLKIKLTRRYLSFLQ